MKANHIYRLLAAVPFLVSPLAVAQVTPYGNPPSFAPLPPPPPNRISLSYRMGFNVSATFSGLGGFPAQHNPAGPSAGGDTDRTYDDGYNLRDVSEADGLTWNWGYQDYPRQIVNDSLLLSVSSSEANGVSSEVDDDPLHGFELTYQRRFSKGESWHWGAELAFNYTGLDISDSRPVLSPVTRITDAYALGGIVPPHAPPPDMAYEGTFAGPGALISDRPTRLPPVTIPDGALTEGHRNLDATIYGFRLGPYLEVSAGEPLFLAFSGGLAVAWVDSEFQFSETTTISGVRTSSSRSGRSSDSDVLVGWFVAGQCAWAFNEHWRLFGSVQYQDVGQFSQSAGGAKATLDLSEGVFATMGVGYSF